MSKSSLNRRILIVGEGRETEYNYFVGFRTAFEEILQATATSVSVRRGKGGDARGIVRNAIKETKKFRPDRKHGDRVFLLLDTEGPRTVPGRGRAPELPAAEKLAAENRIEIVYSCPAFEYWLLCHFPNPSRAHFGNCDAVIAALDRQWSSVCRAAYDKADLDVFRRLSHCSMPLAARRCKSTFIISIQLAPHAVSIHRLRFTNSWQSSLEPDRARSAHWPSSTLWDFKMKLQLKATRQQLTFSGRRYSFPMEIAHYNRLRTLAGSDAPTYLVVFQMPADETNWVECSPEQLILRRCLRWVSLRGAEEVNQGTITVYLPEAHVLTPEALRKLARARSLEPWITYNADGVPHADHV